MSGLLRLKHWQLFILMVAIPLVAQFVFAGIFIANRNPEMIFSVIPIIALLTTIIYTGWLYAIGNNLQPLLPKSVTMRRTLFKWFLLIPLLYTTACMFLMAVILKGFVLDFVVSNYKLFMLILPIHFLSLFCIFYCFYFNAKSLRAVELQKSVVFDDFAGEFFLLWFFPIGIWILQPRINKLFDKTGQQLINELHPNDIAKPVADL